MGRPAFDTGPRRRLPQGVTTVRHPPLPHPTWCLGPGTRDAGPVRPLRPDEFWDRLGL